MKSKQAVEVVRAQCDRCGLVGDRRKYQDESYTKRCPHCGRITGFTLIR